jgi:hypothetical protein
LTQIGGEVTTKFLAGGRHDPTSRAHVATITQAVNEWALLSK